MGDRRWQGDVSRGLDIFSPRFIKRSRISQFNIMVGGINDVVVQCLPCGTGGREIVRIRRSRAQTKGKEEGEDSFRCCRALFIL